MGYDRGGMVKVEREAMTMEQLRERREGGYMRLGWGCG